MAKIYELGYSPDGTTFIETPLGANKIIASDAVTGEKHIVESPDIHFAINDYVSKANFPPTGNEKTLYIVTSAGNEGIWRWNNLINNYYKVGDNSDNILGNVSKLPVEGTTATGATTQNKVVTIAGHVPAVGNVYIITYTAGNTANEPQLNIAGSGAKPVLLGGGRPLGTENSGAHYVAPNGKVLYYYDGTSYHAYGNTNKWETEPTDITSATLDLNDLHDGNSMVGTLGYIGRRHSWIQRNTGGATGIINTPSDIKTSFLLTWEAARYSGTMRGGVQTLIMTTDGVSYRRVYRRWYNSGATPKWGDWFADATVTNAVISHTIEGTVAEITEKLKRFPIIINHALTINILPGDYSNQTLELSKFDVRGTLYIQAKDYVSNRESVKTVKLGTLFLEGCMFYSAVVRGINFNKADAVGGGDEGTEPDDSALNSCVIIRRCRGRIILEYNHYRVEKVNMIVGQYGIEISNNTTLHCSIRNSKFNALRAAFMHYQSVYGVFADNNVVSNCIYGVFGRGVYSVGDFEYSNVSYPIQGSYTTNDGYYINLGEVHRMKKWKRKGITGTSNEFVFLKFRQDALSIGAYRIVAKRTGNMGGAVYEWLVYNGVSEEKTRLVEYVGQSGSAATMKLEYARVGTMSLMFRLTSLNPSIGANTNDITITVSCLHDANENDIWFTPDPPDNPASYTWTQIV